MMAFSRLMKILFFNYLSLFQGAFSEINSDATDGELYIKKLLNKENIAERPESLLFTAPYRICKGGCDKEDHPNFMMAFPMFIGKHGKSIYTHMYQDSKKKMNEIFPSRSSPQTYTTCPTERPMANLNTKSTMYPGYSIITTQSTGYPGYTKNSGTWSTGFPGYTELMRTWSTGIPGSFDKLLEEAIRARLSQPEEYSANYPEQEIEHVNRYATRSGEMQHQWIRRTVSMDKPSPPPAPLLWRPTQPPMKHKDTYVSDLVNRRHNKWSWLLGYRPVLPIRDK